jgi:hypothetical protein
MQLGFDIDITNSEYVSWSTLTSSVSTKVRKKFVSEVENWRA